LDAAIWTGLLPKPANLKGPNVVVEAVAYLTHLEVDGDQHKEARKYVVKTPAQIQTAVRREMRSQGWADEELPAALFEEP
jgi:hypothetical protein